MSKGVFEDMSEVLARVESKIDALVQRGLGGGRPEVRMMGISDLAARYSVAKGTVREMIYRMEAEGFPLQVCRVQRNWMVNVRQFDAAFDKIYGLDSMMGNLLGCPRKDKSVSV